MSWRFLFEGFPCILQQRCYTEVRATLALNLQCPYPIFKTSNVHALDIMWTRCGGQGGVCERSFRYVTLPRVLCSHRGLPTRLQLATSREVEASSCISDICMGWSGQQRSRFRCMQRFLLAIFWVANGVSDRNLVCNYGKSR